MDVKLYIRWYLARIENIKVKIFKHKGCPWETGLSNFSVRNFISHCSDMKKVKPFILSRFKGGQIRREYNEQLYSYGVSFLFVNFLKEAPV